MDFIILFVLGMNLLGFILMAIDKRKARRNHWRVGRIPYLEKVLQGNHKKLSVIMRSLKKFAGEHDLKPSWTGYNKCDVTLDSLTAGWLREVVLEESDKSRFQEEGEKVVR